MQLHGSLTKVDFRVSTACTDPSHAGVWSLLRDFGKWSVFFHAFGDRLIQTSLLPGEQELHIGARRLLHIGGGKLVEQLCAFDEDNKKMAYKLITHPANVNPFNASFVNYTCQVTVRPITMTSQSFIEVWGSFMTEASMVDTMQFSLTCFHETCLRSICQFLGHKDVLEPPLSVPIIGISDKRIGSLDSYMPSRAIGRAASAQPAEFFSATDRQNSSDSTRSQLESSNPMQQ